MILLTYFSPGDDVQFSNINNVHAPKMFDNLNNDQGWIDHPPLQYLFFYWVMNISRSQNEPKPCFCQHFSHITQVSITSSRFSKSDLNTIIWIIDTQHLTFSYFDDA